MDASTDYCNLPKRINIKRDDDMLSLKNNDLTSVDYKPVITDMIDVKKNEINYEDIKIESNMGDGIQDNKLSIMQCLNESPVDYTGSQQIEVIVKNENVLSYFGNECNKCGNIFEYENDLKKHMETHLKVTRTLRARKKRTKVVEEAISETCPVCHKNFKNKRLLKIHMNIHDYQKLYKCDTCCKEFKFRTNLARHILLHKGGPASRPHTCDICKKSFTRKEHLTKHELSHTDSVLHECGLCKKFFKYKSSLRMHLKYHNGEKRFICKICGNRFIRRDNLQVHLKTTHLNATRSKATRLRGVRKTSRKCYICRKEFSGEFTDHFKLHAENLEKCSTCGKSFTTKYSLIRHAKMHLEENPYKCNICDNRYAQKDALALHIQTHTGEEPCTCFICERSFAQKLALRIHMRIHRDINGYLTVYSKEAL